ncbi:MULTISPECIES: SLAC1 anion channel family protein [Aliarcobacter]|jgi:tellurite resistance protein|uniref:SLAC1 anion channel family protein n=1 Tax=Aliarcobacter skirrowii TaxID=28200 RepID=A0AAW9DAC5_9BACT|nr:SLAC1 anion channel family protein [Aliarcobacter skirrowii]AZL54055.1 C4-dicarboxylate ABC transporter [Aliarcobacter skirrowii]MDX4027754.1 SLAC1 anion channel family protein [Aliarcobacter skirrowii]MDX4048435.1 SLAC1 anion channel family protein [Aliarcobacter skirrowii]MDX4057993.1 SLAC1 anion channel family protein [Aliarcobacter skirrowii]MDX4059318.1 SLAC1 anion channel family protein [Aliarcobacter skirrowii]
MQQESIKAIPSNRLQFFPIMMFAVIMGLGGLTLVFEKLNHTFGFSNIFSISLISLTTLLFIAVVFTYILKIFKYKQEVKKELNHPIRINFFAASSISMLILSICFKEFSIEISKLFFYFGAILHLFLTFYTIRFWINNNLEIVHSNPAWFIPIVGNLIVPIAGVSFVDNQILIFYFAIGLFFWIILFSIILNRIIFHNPFAPKFLPTMFILIAPPSIGFISYIKLTSSLDFFAQILFSLALFFTILVAFMYKNFLKIKFFISWWAFTFPMAAVTLSVITMYELTSKPFYEVLAYILSFITTIIVLLVAIFTFKHILKKEICIIE